MYNPLIDIDRRIEDLQRIKSGYQTNQPPINIFNNSLPSQSDFKAQYINENDKVEDLLVQSKTMFFEPKNGKLYIKDINGDVEKYDVVIPKTAEQLKIEELEKRLNDYEQYIATINEKQQSNASNDVYVKSESKTNGKSISKQTN